ncbi:MAG: hypothetical protein Q4A07_04440, partial [Coriobacteriales bacterium]|nr:hypothetical protein [Coriobacteriales bacterium]
MRGTRTGARRVVACVVAALLAAGLLPAAPQAAALAEEAGEIQVLGSEPALGDAIELVGDEVVTTGGSGGDTLE